MKTGDGLTLTCLVAGDEPDSIVWYKDGSVVVSASAIFDIPSNYDPLTYTKVSVVFFGPERNRSPLRRLLKPIYIILR